MSKKKKTRRSKQKFPNLDVKYNLKSRRDYLDNRYYVNGVKQNGKMVMPPLSEKAKKFLNDFNKEYYNASFDSKYDYDNIHVCKVDEETVKDIKDQIRVLKKDRKKIFDKSPNTTTEQDRDLAAYYTQQIEDMEDFLNEVHPRRACEHANNDRNYDFLNMAKASNEYDLVSWEELRDDEYVEYDNDFDPDFFNIKIEED